MHRDQKSALTMHCIALPQPQPQVTVQRRGESQRIKAKKMQKNETWVMRTRVGAEGWKESQEERTKRKKRKKRVWEVVWEGNRRCSTVTHTLPMQANLRGASIKDCTCMAG